MEKAALRHPCLVADVINRRGGVTLEPDDVQCRVEQLGFRFVLGLLCQRSSPYQLDGIIPISWYGVKGRFKLLHRGSLDLIPKDA